MNRPRVRATPTNRPSDRLLNSRFWPHSLSRREDSCMGKQAVNRKPVESIERFHKYRGMTHLASVLSVLGSNWELGCATLEAAHL